MSTDDLTLSRRGLIGVLGGGVASVAFGARALEAFGANDSSVATCLLTPEATEGPYWIDNKLTRYDVREGRPGLPLVLQFTIVNAKTCKPIKGADVEIWHADASGEYSGFDGSSSGGPVGLGGGSGPQTKTRYLRGHQRSDALGKASFLTIFPGWYRGRTPHIHRRCTWVARTVSSTPARCSSTKRSSPPSTGRVRTRAGDRRTRRMLRTRSTTRPGARAPSSSWAGGPAAREATWARS